MALSESPSPALGKKTLVRSSWRAEARCKLKLAPPWCRLQPAENFSSPVTFTSPRGRYFLLSATSPQWSSDALHKPGGTTRFAVSCAKLVELALLRAASVLLPTPGLCARKSPAGSSSRRMTGEKCH